MNLLALPIVRRLVVLGAASLVIVAAVVTVQVAASWRSSNADLAVAPITLDAVIAASTTEADRAAALQAELDALHLQMADLSAAVAAADSQISGDTSSASALKAELDAARARLATLEGQLAAAQQRLAALNAAQAAAPAAGAGRGDDDHDDDDHEDHDDD